MLININMQLNSIFYEHYKFVVMFTKSHVKYDSSAYFDTHGTLVDAFIAINTLFRRRGL